MQLSWLAVPLAWTALIAPPPAQDPAPGAPVLATPPPTAGATLAATHTSIRTIYTNLPGHPTAAVPGVPGASFGPGTSTTHFDRPFASPNGHWILSADTDLATNQDEVVLVDGVLVAREGTPAPWAVGQNFGVFDTELGIDDLGDWAIATNVAPTTSNDDYIVRADANGAFQVFAHESDSVPGLTGVTYDDVLAGPFLLGNGTVGFQADGLDGNTTAGLDDEIVVLGTTVVAQTGVTIPTGQAGGATAAWENFRAEAVHADALGSHLVILGDLVGANADDIVALDGAVVLQEGQPIPGSGFAQPIDDAGIVGVGMDAAGHWFARGNNDLTEDDWVVRDGAVIAAVGRPIVLGSAEVWDDTGFSDGFFAFAGNSIGDWVVGGETSQSSSALDAVLVYNGTDVVARESDPVDLDGNGLFDDGAFLRAFGTDDLALTDRRELYFTATLSDATGAAMGQGFFKLSIVPEPHVFCTAKVNSAGCTPSIGFTGDASASAGNGFHVRATNVLSHKAGLCFYSTKGPNNAPFFGGIMCLSSPLRLTPIQNSGGAAPCGGVLDVDFNVRIASGADPLLIAGNRVWAQFWSRDPADPQTVNLTDALEFTIGS